MSNKLIAALLIVLFFATVASAKWDYGARATGMGGAFVALSDDNNAAAFNPAGLGFSQSIKVSATAAGYFEPATLDLFSVSIPTEYGTVGVSFSDAFVPTNIQPDVRIGFANPEPINIAAKTFVLAYGYELNKIIPVKENMGRMAIGASIRSISNSDYNNTLLYDSPQLAETSCDASFLYKINPMLSVGVVAKDLISDGPSAGTPEWNAGAAITINNLVTLSQDLNATGVEVRLGDIALRAGVNEGTPSFGAGIIIGDMQFDYAFKDTSVNTQSAHYFSLSYAPSI